MAKAILGHVGGSDPRLLAEVARLRRRVAELEAEVARLGSESAALLDSFDGQLDVLAQEQLPDTLGEDIITLDAPDPERSTPALA
jgi:uncharacterized small protein (DUF1192 family)